MVFMIVLCHVVLKTSHLSTSYPGSTQNQRDWRGLPTAGLHFILIRSACLEDNHSVRTSSPGPQVYSLFQNRVQGCDFTVVVPLNMSDKQGQQRRGRADGAIRSAVDRCPVGKDPALAPETKETPPRRTTACRRRKVLEGILWILRSGARWCDLPVEF